jgi:hypothetical protein
VKTCVHNAFAKLGITSREQLAQPARLEMTGASNPGSAWLYIHTVLNINLRAMVCDAHHSDRSN